jgi:formylglycine-generating enzyme required for sulfatase activity
MFTLNEAKRDGGLVGERMSGHLIPETVATGTGISVGRFEVTNAQYQSFREAHAFGAGYGNHPVTGVSMNDIQAYLTWLRSTTGRTYRLPNAEEAAQWNEIAVEVGAQELTLNYLAGYTLGVLDAPALRAKAMELAPEALIRAVGQFAPSLIGAARVYDLGGNVAEIHAAGVYGYSAIDYVDSAAPEARNVVPEFTGFRVVRE